ncbi:MAG TPA: FMN-binding protein [Gammaproteobacteria bacterium]|nr:FMN-binding protein [Gammaproteobacteria bacterium]HJO11636.1 FMN-binding protein [Gammaproteobacteria bacterium]
MQKPSRSSHHFMVILGLLAIAVLFDETGPLMLGISQRSASQQVNAAASDSDNMDPTLLQEVMPVADSFSEKQGQPPVFRAYRAIPNSDEQMLVGYVFLTADMPPQEVGYSGPIEVLVGMDMTGTLTGIKVLHYIETLRRLWGDFLATTPGYQEQFAGKAISEAFREGRDVDGIVRATVTVKAMSRGIRNSARRVARAYL